MYGVVDIGSNTVRLVVYRVCGGQLRAVLNNKVQAGLASYITREGRLSREGVDQAVAVMTDFKQVVDAICLKDVLVFGTAALRNVTNTQEVVEAISDACGIRVDVINGQDEALFDYYGAVRGGGLQDGVLADVGGGSTELLHFQDGVPTGMVSLPVGSLTLFTGQVAGILPTAEELDRIRQRVKREMQSADFSETFREDVLCGVGGTARAAQKFCTAMGWTEGESYDASHLADILELGAKRPGQLAEKLLRLAPERIHTFLPGVAVLNEAARTFACRTVITSPYGVREGYLYRMLEKRGELGG